LQHHFFFLSQYCVQKYRVWRGPKVAPCSSDKRLGFMIRAMVFGRGFDSRQHLKTKAAKINIFLKCIKSGLYRYLNLYEILPRNWALSRYRAILYSVFWIANWDIVCQILRLSMNYSPVPFYHFDLLNVEAWV